MLNLIRHLLNRSRIARVLAEIDEPIAQRKAEARMSFVYYATEAWEGFDR